MRFTVALLLAASLCGGPLPKVGSGFKPPQVTLPASFSVARTDAAREDESALARWWTTLRDAKLDSLVERALASNLDVKLAGERLLEARASRRLARADLLPTVQNSESFQRVRGGFNQGIIRVDRQNPSPGIISAFETNVFQLGFDASWELDFFGGKRRALEAATAEVQSSVEARHDVLVSLLAETARNYLELRGAQRRLQLTRDNIGLQKDSLHLTDVRAQAGLGTALDIERQRAQLEASEALIPQLELTVAERIHALSTLLAQPPDALASELSAIAPLPAALLEPPAGLPARLLKRRPDIRQSEAEIAAASARVGVARADFFPKISLTGSAGRQATDFPGFTAGVGNFFAVGPGVKLPLFTGGRLKANLAVQKQRFEQSLTAYRSTVLRGLRETEDALSAYNRERERRENLAASARSSREAVRLARELYTGGLSDFLSVLDAQRQQLATETDLASSDTLALTNLVSVYKALGGGWTVAP